MRRLFPFLVFVAGLPGAAAPPPAMSSASQLTPTAETLEIEFVAPGLEQPGHALFVALGAPPVGGSARVPHGPGREGSAVFLPFAAERLYVVRSTETALAASWREWRQGAWSGPLEVKPEFTARRGPGRLGLRVRLAALGRPRPAELRVAVWAKRLGPHEGWGELLPDAALGVRGGAGDQYLDRARVVVAGPAPTVRVERRPGAGAERVRIYQLLPRLFANTNETRRPHGTLAENGVGKFAGINAAALAAIRALGCTHVWLTGVLSQATATDYAALGLPADDPDLLKGLAGSPYAIRDYFDVCPDYAVEPAARQAEFRALVERAHAAGLKVLLDFVPNHVARSYRSTVRPELSFGAEDDRTRFFAPGNNFFWLPPEVPGGGPPLRLPTVAADGAWLSPTCRVLQAGDGLFPPERVHGRVTGNNAVTWRPGPDDWYETVKLNYGYDFTTGRRAYPHAEAPAAPLPDTWRKMDAVLAHWQAQGVDGFRCDMAHLVPPEFWAWALARARQRVPGTFFAAEAYDNDPMKVGSGEVRTELLAAGFDAVYDDPSYKVLKGLYEGPRWANDLDGVHGAVGQEFFFHNALRYAENHDEVRLAGRGQWGGHGAAVGRPVSALLYGLARGPVLLYAGQEVGEPAEGAEGYGGDDARTTIFDYWSLPELAKWVNDLRYDGGRLSPAQVELRAFYARLLALVGEPAFRDGEFFGLNYAHRDEPGFGRLPGETASGHWLYAFLRSDLASGQRCLVVINLHPTATLRDVQVRLPPEALAFTGLAAEDRLELTEQLSTAGRLRLVAARAGAGVALPEIPPLTPYYFALQKTAP